MKYAFTLSASGGQRGGMGNGGEVDGRRVAHPTGALIILIRLRRTSSVSGGRGLSLKKNSCFGKSFLLNMFFYVTPSCR